MRRGLGWLLPGGPVLALAVAVHLWAPESMVAQLGGGYPWVAYAVTMLLAWLFQRSRVAVAVVALVAVHLVLDHVAAPQVPALAGASFALVLATLALLRDRGVLTAAGLAQLALAGAVGGTVALVALSDPPLVDAALAAAPLPPGLLAWTHLPQAVLLAFAAATAATTWSALRWGGAVDKGFLWAVPMVAAGVALSMGHTAVAAGGAVVDAVGGALFLLAAALTLALSMVETSYAMAYRDDLTGLPARRALQRDLGTLGTTYAVAMVDVDHFKRFNDRHGHDVGDQVLRMVATRLARAPGGGKAYRYGGEEFTLLFAGRTREETLPHLEAARAAVEDARFALRGHRRPRGSSAKEGATKRKGAPSSRDLSVTVSIGIADSTGTDPSPEGVLKKADQALYRAKRKGRNQVSK